MALDFTNVSQQIQQMGAALRSSFGDREQRLELALERLASESLRWRDWADAATTAYKKSPWLLAAPTEPLLTRRPLPQRPPAYTLLATDGSQIDLDRHGAAECYLINLGMVLLRYGSQPECVLRSQPQLFFQEHEIMLRDPSGRQYAMAGPLVNAERDTREGVALAQLAASAADGGACVAMQDGTLIRWSLSGLDPWLLEYFLERYLADGLASMRASGVALCSYISRPRAPEITGLLRLIEDPDFQKTQQAGPSDDPYRGINDAQIFRPLLAEGERSAVFRSLSKINVERYEEHQIHFFYLNIGPELVRIELPEWTALDPAACDLVHAVAYDQAQRGGGYPVALARAHEQAVVRETDRRVFRQMLEATMWQSRLGQGGSLKADSKEWQRV